VLTTAFAQEVPRKLTPELEVNTGTFYDLKGAEATPSEREDDPTVPAMRGGIFAFAFNEKAPAAQKARKKRRFVTF
jgi:hypothetical protein